MNLINLVRGFLMAVADSMPGVSGGTIAFIMGFYDKLIKNIDTIIYSKTIREKKEPITFLLQLGVGWIIGLVLSVKLISSIFENNIYLISSLFIGFIVFSIPYLILEEVEVLKKNKKGILFTVVGAIGVYLISSQSGEVINIGGSLNETNYIYLFFSGAIAISAMILPGISGSTLLLILGVYSQIIFTIDEVISFNFANIDILIIFAIGIFFGALFSVKTVSYCLKKYRSSIIYLVIGLMIGSIYAITVGPATLDTPVDKMDSTTFNFIFFIIGGMCITLLEKMNRREKR